MLPAAAQNSVSLRFDDVTTDIESVNSKSEEPDAIFDLAGRRIKRIEAPGIYIVGGKKVLVK